MEGEKSRISCEKERKKRQQRRCHRALRGCGSCASAVTDVIYSPRRRPLLFVSSQTPSCLFHSVSLEHSLTQTPRFSENSHHLSVTLFVVASQFVALLCFKVQLLSEIDFFLFTETTETQWTISELYQRGDTRHEPLFSDFSSYSQLHHCGGGWGGRGIIKSITLSQKHYGWLKHLWIRFTPVYYRYQDNLSQSPAYTSNSIFQRFLKTPINIKNVGNKPFSETTDAFQFHVQRVINHIPHWLYHKTVISRSKWHVYYLCDSPRVVCCVIVLCFLSGVAPVLPLLPLLLAPVWRSTPDPTRRSGRLI